MQRLLLLVEKGNYSERRAVTGLHLAALRAGIRPPRIVSRVARTIRTSAALGGSTAVTLVVPAMEWMRRQMRSSTISGDFYVPLKSRLMMRIPDMVCCVMYWCVAVFTAEK